MSAEEPQTEREWLMRLDQKLDGVLTTQQEMKKTISGDDGQGGLCARVLNLEKQQSRWLGRDGAITLVIGSIGGSIVAAVLWLLGVGR